MIDFWAVAMKWLLIPLPLVTHTDKYLFGLGWDCFHFRDDRVREAQTLIHFECDMIAKDCTFQLVSKLGEDPLG